MGIPENEHRNRCLIRGALLGGGLALLFFLPWVGGQLAGMGPQDPEYQAVALVFFFAPFVAGIAAGAVLGYFAARIQTYRYVKLLGIALALYLCAAYVSAFALILLTEYLEPGGVPDGIFYGVLYLGTVGAIFLGAILVPMIMVVVFLLERWTRLPAPTGTHAE